MPRRKEGDPKEGLKVVPNAADVAYKWLKTIHAITELPISDPGDANRMSTLPLGSLELHNTLVHIVSPQLVYIPGESYQIQTIIVPNANEDTPKIDSSRRSAIILPTFSSSSVPVPLDKLATTLKGRKQLSDYNIDYGVFTEKIEISEEVQGNQYSITTGGNPFGGPTYFLDGLKAQIEDDPKKFETKYNLYARLLEEVILSLYQTKQKVSPEVTLDFAPPDDTESSVKKMEKALGMTRRRLSIAGLDDEADDEEIKSRIIMERPEITFSDVGGQEKAKVELGDVVAGFSEPEKFTRRGTRSPRGILLYGPPGTGKTLLSRATAGEANVTIFSVELASILHSLWGRTEKYIQRIFDMAKEQSSAIIFFDEIDAIARQRSSLNQAYSSIVNILGTNMDGMRGRANNVVVIGATNLLDLVDEALIRPGRFDMWIHVDVPDEKGRLQIFEIHKKEALKIAQRPEHELFDPNFDKKLFIARTKGFSGADIAELLRRTLLEGVRMERRGIEPHPVTAEDYVAQIELYEQIRKDKARKVQSTSFGFHSGMTPKQ